MVNKGSISAIVAMGRNGEIGRQGDMPWHLPEDLRRFKDLTTGHPVIMGRATWDSLPRRPLPGRLNIVISRQHFDSTDEVKFVNSIEQALEQCQPGSEPFIIGGGTIYKASMPLLSRIYVTRIEEEYADADTFFPVLDPKEWQLTDTSEVFVSKTGLKYRFETYERSNSL